MYIIYMECFLTPGKVNVRSYGGSFALWKKGQRTHISIFFNKLSSFYEFISNTHPYIIYNYTVHEN